MSEWFATYKKTIVSTLIVTTIIILGFSLIYGCINGSISKFFQEFFQIISPITIGFIIAYLSNPIVSFFEKWFFRWIPRFSIKRLVSILTTLILIIACISFVITMLIPNILSTLYSFWDTYIVNYQSSLEALAIRINVIMDGFDFLDTVQRIDPQELVKWVQENFPWIDSIVEGDFSDILPQGYSNADPYVNEIKGASADFDISSLLSSEALLSVFGYAFSLGTSLFNIVKDLLLGIFIAIYMLMSKEKFKAYLRRFLNSFLPPRKVRAIVRFGKLIDRSFGGFIEGQILDAIVVGIVSYIVFVIFAIPIPHLLATIIAVTNVIPIFGPFIGGIPAAILVLLTEPEKTFLFILLILIIQQIDGNIICPHILGDKINISSLATIIAIVTMGGLFGIFGMLIGVPVFAVIIHVINNYTMNALRRKGLETSLEHYYVGNIENIIDSPHKENTNTDTFVSKLSSFTKKYLIKEKKEKKKKEK